MGAQPDVSRIAGLLRDPARASMLRTLVDGTMRPAGELAYAANIPPQSAAAHLAVLVEGGLLEIEAQGRHRYFRIAGAEVAGLIEGMASLSAGSRPRAPRSPLPSPAAPVQFLHARTCYGHLAGEVAVKILDSMLEGGWLTSDGRDFAVTAAGEKKLAALGVDVESLRTRRGVFARSCVDLTQRRAHLGGALGVALVDVYAARGWIRKHPRSRVVSITPEGRKSFRRVFGRR